VVCKKGTISGSLIQKIWWWISRKEVKLKLFVEMDEREVDNFFREAVGWDSSVFTGEGVGSTKPKPKKGNSFITRSHDPSFLSERSRLVRSLLFSNPVISFSFLLSA